MFEVFNISWVIIKQNWIFFSVSVLISCAVACYNLSNVKVVYEAHYIGAPYYETATDVTYKVRELSVAINDKNQAYINMYLSDSINVNDLRNATVKKESKAADYTFKHIKVRLLVDVNDSNNLSVWDRKLHDFYVKASNIKNNQYRGREVLKERIKILADKQYGYDVSAKNDSDLYLNILKGYLERDTVIVSDSNMVDLVFARYIAEYRNSIGVNQIDSLISSYRLKNEQDSQLWKFLYTLFGPSFFILLLWSSYKDYKFHK
tara:strand:- start:158 stop:943 length:786 start_codon:yes stop_codon:yes gene_type:complete